MKITVYPLLALFVGVLSSKNLNAQCPYEATVNEGDLILCPNETGQISTQTYDSYQWYWDGSPLAGETNQTLSFLNGGEYHVEVSLNGCVSNSDTIFVDGYFFALPSVGFDRPTIDAGVYALVPGDSIILIAATYLGPGTTFQWLNSGVPIAGETDDSLVVTTPGFYSLNQSPGLCPNFVMNSGSEIEVVSCQGTGELPIITQSNDTLYASNGTYYRWSHGFNSTILSLEPFFVPTEEGFYYVATLDANGCQVISEGFYFIPSTAATVELTEKGIELYPNPARDQIFLKIEDDRYLGNFALVDARGVLIKNIEVKKGINDINIKDLQQGIYFLVHTNMPFRGKLFIE